MISYLNHDSAHDKKQSQKKEQKLLSAKNDFIFKLIFGDYRNMDILTDFLMSVLDIPREELEQIEIIDPHLRKESAAVGGAFDKGKEEGKIEEGIEILILDNLDEKIPKERIIEKLQKRFNLDKQEAVEYYERYHPI